jgi:hypothetical protein
MRLHDFFWGTRPESLNESTKLPQRAVRERACGIGRSAEP